MKPSASWDPKEGSDESQPGILMNGVLNGKNPIPAFIMTRSELLSKKQRLKTSVITTGRISMKKAVLKMSKKKPKRFMMQAMLLAPRYRGFSNKPGIWSV